ncbi:N-acetylmuramoyl-L-alanine amidase [Cuneatibacter sp. NSJ-177]|uniref:peptidoglycan recognition protein family protein n=1 Tax=Cuneatibacter sp. NSJ-177 TaxID=2931401 RepID=UPI001FD48BB1|nr:peptidoglycan recognition family protein [Cuneatibacter sp. NSJ-177]MCJ7834847.1 N-acetylmuramoyl-L-alanine amidase [Cuneatibacter sp. NSJ-177]
MNSKNKSVPPRYVMAILLIGFCVLSAVTLVGAYQAKKALPPYVGKQLTEAEMNEVIARNSPFTSYVHLSPNADFPRESEITKITIHHMGADLTLERLGESFAKRDRNASSNYGIDRNGSVALYVEEANRSWASSNAENDHMAITIEVANETIGGDWRVSEASYQALIELCADICRRNGIHQLEYTGDAGGNLTTHNMFRKDTECPGPYLEGKMAEIAEAVNQKLSDSRE